MAPSRNRKPFLLGHMGYFKVKKIFVTNTVFLILHVHTGTAVASGAE